MKIIRWLLSHSLFILLIVAVIYAYMFWGNLLGKDTPAGKAVAYLSSEFVEVEEFVNAIKAKQAQLSEEQSSDQDSSRSEMAETANTSDSDKAPQQIVSIEPESIESAPIEPESIATEEVVVEAKTEVASKPVASQPVIEQPHIESIKPESIEPESIAAEEVVVEHKTEVASAPVDEQQPVIISQSQKEVPQNEKPSKQPIKQSGVATIDSKDEHKQVNEAALADSRQSTTVNKTQAASDNADVAVSSAPAAMAMTQRGTEGAFVSAEVAKQLDNVDDHGEVIDASQPSGAVRENWITARKSFYQRNYELSEQSYQQVIDSTKNNYDAYGELGNVYFNQGKNKQVASAYFEAAAILVSKGQFYRVRSLMGLLRYLDKAKANELQQLIASTKS